MYSYSGNISGNSEKLPASIKMDNHISIEYYFRFLVSH